MQTGWHVREGRNQEFVIWEDALNDMLPRIGLTRAAANEMPPERPAGDSLSAERMILWGQALVQYQDEGTALFDALRPSLLIDGPYANRDIRLIAGWKRDGVKDGRALLRWALSFVDRSSINDQMQVLSEMNAMRLSAQATLFDLSEHCLTLLELWSSLASSDRREPAAFFRQLLVSMPTTPECPVVHVRRMLVDMIELGTSPLLKDLDGEKGLFHKMESYGRSLGMSDKMPSSLNALGSDVGAGGGNPRDRNPRDRNPRDRGGGADEAKCDNCRAFACHRQGGDCICKSDSKFNVRDIKEGGRREYVKLMRKYNKANPGKTLLVNVQLVRDAMGIADPRASEKSAGNVNFMATVASVLGDEMGDDSNAIDKWLAEQADDADGFFVLGDTSGGGDLTFEITADPDETELLAVLNHESSDDSGRSATAAETEMETLRTQLLLAEARANEAESRLSTAQVKETPRAPNDALDRPPSFSREDRICLTPSMPRSHPSRQSGAYLNMTPKDLYFNLTQGSPMPQTPATSKGGVTVRRSSCERIEEEHGASVGGAKDKYTAAELMARSMVAAEAEKRKLKALIKDNGKLKVLRVLARLLLSGAGRAYDVGTSCAEYAADLSIQQLVTIALLVYVFGNKVKPLLKLGITRVLNMLLKLGAGQMQSLLLTARSSLTAISAAIIAKLVNIALKLAMRSNPTATAAQSVSSTSPLPTATGSLLMMSNFRMSNAVLMTTQELEVTDGLKAALMDNGASSNTSCSKSLEGAISGTFKAEDAGEIGLGSDGASLTSNGSYLYALKRFGFNGSELVVRRLKHTPNLPMEYVFSEATENKKHGYGIYWEPGKRRILKSPSGQEIELFHSNSDLGWLKVSVVTNKDTILSMLKVQKSRGANLTVLTGAPPPPPPPSSSGPSAVVSQWQSTVKPTESGDTAVQDVQGVQVNLKYLYFCRVRRTAARSTSCPSSAPCAVPRRWCARNLTACVGLAANPTSRARVATLLL